MGAAQRIRDGIERGESGAAAAGGVAHFTAGCDAFEHYLAERGGGFVGFQQVFRHFLEFRRSDERHKLVSHAHEGIQRPELGQRRKDALGAGEEFAEYVVRRVLEILVVLVLFHVFFFHELEERGVIRQTSAGPPHGMGLHVLQRVRRGRPGVRHGVRLELAGVLHPGLAHLFGIVHGRLEVVTGIVEREGTGGDVDGHPVRKFIQLDRLDDAVDAGIVLFLRFGALELDALGGAPSLEPPFTLFLPGQLFPVLGLLHTQLLTEFLFH